MGTETITEYVTRRGITCEIVRDRGAQVEDGWEHHAYVVKLTCQGREIETPWRQGHGIEDSPSDRPDMILDSLVSVTIDEPFETWCLDYGYDEDSRKAYATWETCHALTERLAWFLGSAEELERVRVDVERL